MNASLTIDDQKFNAAVKRFADLKGKTDEEVINKAMKYWVPFVSAKLIPKTAGEIRTELTGQAARISRGRKKQAGQLRNTLAAAIIAARFRKRGLDTRIPDFYFHVQKLVNSRGRSAGYIRAGMIPDMQKFGVPLRGVPRMKARGYSGGHKAKLMGGFTVALSRDARAGASKRYPNAYRDSLPEVTRMFLKFIDQDYNKLATKTGF
jgi:hypothetical protein